MNRSSFGLIGLGVMGKSIALNIAENEFSLSVYNRITEGESEVVNEFLKTNSSYKKLQGFTDLLHFVQSLERPRKILIMIKAGSALDEVIENILPLLSAGDILLDGGNSHYLDTARRIKYLKKKNIRFLGVGISGGEEGARKGPSIMPGGERSAYNQVATVLESVSAKDPKGDSCCTYIGPEGSGHFVKMVHNGIEYAEMQLIAEMYALLSQTMINKEIADIFTVWNKADLSGYLLEISSKILIRKEGDQYLLDLILDRAENKGTGSWSSIAALDLGIPNTMMNSAVFARYISSFKERRVTLSKNIKKANNGVKIRTETLKKAYNFARIINHHQGFELIKEASQAYNWDLNLSEIARIWTNGCIIKSDFMQRCSSLYKMNDNLLKNDDIIKILNAGEQDMNQVLISGLSNRIALPAFTAANNYWIGITSKNLPANMIQAQRDFFGAHTYERKDDSRKKYFHTDWN